MRYRKLKKKNEIRNETRVHHPLHATFTLSTSQSIVTSCARTTVIHNIRNDCIDERNGLQNQSSFDDLWKKRNRVSPPPKSLRKETNEKRTTNY